MSAKAYIMLTVTGGKSAQVLQTLRDQKGVLMADRVEGPPNIAAVIEAPDRQKLADLGVQAIASVESMIEDIRLLPTKMDSHAGTSEHQRVPKKQSDS